MRLIAAAVKHRGVVFTGVRHGHIIKDLVDLGLISEAERPLSADCQGFIDENGNYYQRKDARQVALKAGQIEPGHSTVYSEDLW